jgi:hypothetical protein
VVVVLDIRNDEEHHVHDKESDQVPAPENHVGSLSEVRRSSPLPSHALGDGLGPSPRGIKIGIHALTSGPLRGSDTPSSGPEAAQVLAQVVRGSWHSKRPTTAGGEPAQGRGQAAREPPDGAVKLTVSCGHVPLRPKTGRG